MFSKVHEESNHRIMVGPSPFGLTSDCGCTMYEALLYALFWPFSGLFFLAQKDRTEGQPFAFDWLDLNWKSFCGS